MRASWPFSRASCSPWATLPPAVGARSGSVDFFLEVVLRAAWGSDGPLRSFFTHLSPSFSYSCFNDAKATRWAESPYVSTALSCVSCQIFCACVSERSIVLGMSDVSFFRAIVSCFA